MRGGPSASRTALGAYARAIEELDRITAGPRRRYAEAVFWTGSGARTDALASRAFFELSATLWSDRGQDDEHLQPYMAGLELCGSPTRAADLGTGTGSTADCLAARFPQASVVGVDSSWAMLRVARRQHRQPNLRYLRADLRRLPFGDGELDLITAHNALPEPRELSRVCRTGGGVMLANTYLQPSWGLLARLSDMGLRLLARRDVGAGGFVFLERAAGPQPPPPAFESPALAPGTGARDAGT